MLIPKKVELIAYYRGNETREDFSPPAQARRLELILAAVREYIRPGALVVDIGCGNGYVSGRAVASIPGVRLVGIEYSAPKVQEGADRYGVLPVVGDGEIIPLRSASADAVLCCETLEHVPSPETALAEIRRILRPSGVAILTIPLSGRAHAPLVKLYHWLRRRPEIFAEHLHFFTIGRACRMVRAAGLAILESRCHGFTFLGLEPSDPVQYAAWDHKFSWVRIGLTGKPERLMIGQTFLLVIAGVHESVSMKMRGGLPAPRKGLR